MSFLKLNDKEEPSTKTGYSDALILATPPIALFGLIALSIIGRTGSYSAALLGGVIELLYRSLLFVAAVLLAYFFSGKSEKWRTWYLILGAVIIIYSMGRRLFINSN